MPTVTISQGKLKGGKTKTESGLEYYEFLGIPYAQPPVGELRFKSPRDPEPWQIEKDVTTVDKINIPSQIDFLSGEAAGSEDCLYLNVYTPKEPTTKGESLPVMVYIHGGGFVMGNGILKSESGPDFLLENNVIVVTINYRLGIFGFLSLDIPEAAGNMGLKDQVKALQWIQKNISEFGGDKNNVTLFGISAGAASIEYLILSPSAKGLFHKAILQSGSSINDWAINYDMKPLLVNLVTLLGYKGSMEDNRAIYDFLQNIPSPTLTGAAFKSSEMFTAKRIYFGFVPTIEKDFGNGDAFLTACPYALLSKGNFNKLPIIRGFCDKEGLLINMMKPTAARELITNKTFMEHWSYKFDSIDTDKYDKAFLQEYMKDIKADDDFDKLAVDFYGDLHFTAGIWTAAKLLARHEVPIYMYRFSYDGKLNFFKSIYGLMRKGAGHGDDTTYILRIAGLDPLPIDKDDILLRSKITKMWTNFAKTSDPTPSNCDPISVNWPTFSEGCQQYLDIAQEITIRKDYEPSIMALFEDIYEKYEK